MGVQRPSGLAFHIQDWSPSTEEDREAVRVQLRQVLASPVFGRSKGCSNLLAYIVEATLAGDTQRLKERVIGVEVFGRAPDYDTAADHVVRSTAGDVRKRLAQYYMEPGRSHEIRIDLPPGTYIARFVRPATLPVSPPPEPGNGNAAPVSRPGRRAVIWRGGHYSRFERIGISMAVIGTAVLCVLAVRAYLAGSSGRTLERFWEPVLQSPNPVLLCIGDSGPPSPLPQPGSPRPVERNGRQVLPGGAFRGGDRVFLNDAIALARIAGFLQNKAKPYRILAHSTVTFSDLQNSPAVLIGLRNNYWTASLAGPLRFTVEPGTVPNVLILRDKKNPSRSEWSVDLSTPYTQPAKDYALIVREFHPKTGQVVVTVGGITRHGTLAASDFLTNPAQISSLGAYGPKNWEKKNVVIVLSTEVIRGSPGLAKVIAAEFW